MGASQPSLTVPADVRRLLAVLTPRPYTVRTIGELLDMSNDALQTLLREHYELLTAFGVQFHRATKSEERKAVQLPSIFNPNEPAYYSKLSRPATT